MGKCEDCGFDKVSAKVEKFSKEKYSGKVLCFKCQQKESTSAGTDSTSNRLETGVDRERLIVRQTCIKAAAHVGKTVEECIIAATAFEKFVYGEK